MRSYMKATESHERKVKDKYVKEEYQPIRYDRDGLKVRMDEVEERSNSLEKMERHKQSQESLKL